MPQSCCNKLTQPFPLERVPGVQAKSADKPSSPGFMPRSQLCICCYNIFPPFLASVPSPRESTVLPINVTYLGTPGQRGLILVFFKNVVNFGRVFLCQDPVQEKVRLANDCLAQLQGGRHGHFGKRLHKIKRHDGGLMGYISPSGINRPRASTLNRGSSMKEETSCHHRAILQSHH